MKPIIFPQGFIIEQKNLCLDLMNEHSKQWNIERFQLERGELLGSIHAAHTPRMQIGFSTYSNAIAIKGDYPKGTILISLFSKNSSTIYQDKKIRPNELTISRDGDEIDLIINKKSTIFTLAVEEKYFNYMFEKYFLKTLDTSIKDKKIFIKEEKSVELSQLLLNWISQLQDTRFLQSQELNYPMVEDLILEQLFDSIDIQEEIGERKKFDISIVKTLLDNSIENDIEISTLLKDLNISKRQFHSLFKEKYGYSPKKYLQTLRLNLIQKELLLANQDDIKISDIAFKYGYRHMSHFANEYKIMFGELPSKTFTIK